MEELVHLSQLADVYSCVMVKVTLRLYLQLFIVQDYHLTIQNVFLQLLCNTKYLYWDC